MTVTSSVGFCLGVGALSLIVSMIFGGQGIGSAAGTLKMQKIWAAMKRHSKALTALAGLLLPTFAFGQPEQGGGGEANLMLPDLKTPAVNFFGMNGHALLTWGLLVLRLRPLVRPGDLCAVEKPAGSSHDARNFRNDL